MKIPQLDRRAFLAASSVAALPMTYSGSAKAKETFAMDRGFEDYKAYFRIISDFGGQSTFRYNYGKILYAPGPMRRADDFLEYVSLKQDRSRRLPNGDFQHAYKGMILFNEVETGRILDEFDNPYTKETVKVKHFTTSGGSIVYTPRGPYLLRPGADPSVPPKISSGMTNFDWAGTGDDIWLTYPERSEYSDKSGKVIGVDNTMFRYQVSLAQLRDTSITNVDTVMSWQAETGPWPWMKMDRLPGHLLFGGMGGKYPSLGHLPENYVKGAEKRFPRFLSEPIDWSSFNLPDAAG